MLLLAAALSACGGDDTANEVVEAPPPLVVHPWDEFIDAQIEETLAAHPAWAVVQGRHEFDGQLPDWSAFGLEREVERLRNARRAAQAFAEDQLSPLQLFQREYFISRIDHDLFWLTKANWPYRNPQFYLGWMSDSLDPAPYLTLNYAPPEQRMKAFVRYLRNVPLATKSIRSNLRMPMPLPWLQLGVDAFGGYASYFRDDVPSIWEGVGDAALQADFAAANAEAISAMQGLADWLESGRNIADSRYALGEELYAEMLWDTERVSIGLADLEAAGRADMARNLRDLRKACDEFAPGLGLPECMGKMSARKPSGGPVAAARLQLEETRAFLEAQDLVSIPGSEQALVEESPPYARSNSAYISIPGPWEENQPSVYYISPPNPAWSEEVQASYIPGESDLLFTSVHEVWPGHFLNFMHANRAPWIFGRAFVNYAFGEGWAHYTEEMMLEAGLRGADAETRIGQLSNALLRNARLISSIGLHTQGWSVSDAQAFFMDEAYQSEGTALQQAARGTYDPAYLNYTMGKLLIKQLREDWTAQRGGRGAWKSFHDTFLTFGGPPIPLVRQQMMEESEPRAVFPEAEFIPVAPIAEEASEVLKQLNWSWDCGDGSKVLTSEGLDGLTVNSSFGSVVMSRVESASGARYAGENQVWWTKGEEATLNAEGQDLRCDLNRYESIWEDARLRDAYFRAVGNEPGWHVELFLNEPSTLVVDYGEKSYSFQIGPPEPAEPGPGTVFRGDSDGLEIVVTRRPEECADTMADHVYPMTVEVTVGDKTYRGCGRTL